MSNLTILHIVCLSICDAIRLDLLNGSFDFDIRRYPKKSIFRIGTSE